MERYLTRNLLLFTILESQQKHCKTCEINLAVRLPASQPPGATMPTTIDDQAQHDEDHPLHFESGNGARGYTHYLPKAPTGPMNAVTRQSFVVQMSVMFNVKLPSAAADRGTAEAKKPGDHHRSRWRWNASVGCVVARHQPWGA